MKSRFALGFYIFVSAVAGAQVRPKPSPPNVFLITIDTLRADHVHCYGYDKIQTPALDDPDRAVAKFAQCDRLCRASGFKPYNLGGAAEREGLSRRRIHRRGDSGFE